MGNNYQTADVWHDADYLCWHQSLLVLLCILLTSDFIPPSSNEGSDLRGCDQPEACISAVREMNLISHIWWWLHLSSVCANLISNWVLSDGTITHGIASTAKIISFTDVDADLIIFSNKITRLAQYLCKSVACGDEVLVLHQSQDSRWICI